MSNFETLTSGGGWRGGDIWCTETGTRCTTRRGGEGVSVCQVTALLKCGPSASPRVGSWHRTNGRLRVAVRGEGDQTWLPAACSLRRQAGPTAQMVERPVPVWLRAWDTPLSVYHQLGTHAHRHQEPTIHDCGRQDPDACDFPLLTPPPPPGSVLLPAPPAEAAAVPGELLSAFAKFVFDDHALGAEALDLLLEGALLLQQPADVLLETADRLAVAVLWRRRRRRRRSRWYDDSGGGGSGAVAAVYTPRRRQVDPERGRALAARTAATSARGVGRVVVGHGEPSCPVCVRVCVCLCVDA